MTRSLLVRGEPSLTAVARRAETQVADGTQSTGLHDVRRGDTVEYRGRSWDPNGGPIDVMLGDEVLAQVEPAREFNGSFEFEGFPLLPDGAEDACRTDLHARQDTVDVTLALLADPGEKILHARGLSTADGKKLPDEVIACRGWNEGVTNTKRRWDLVTEMITGRVAATDGLLVRGGEIEAGGRWVVRGVGDEIVVDAVPVFGPIRLRKGDGHVDIPGDGARARAVVRDFSQRNPDSFDIENGVFRTTQGCNGKAFWQGDGIHNVLFPRTEVCDSLCKENPPVQAASLVRVTP